MTSLRKHIRQLASESLVYSVFGLITRQNVAAAVLVPLYSRIFPPEGYGVISLIAAIATFISTLAVAGLDNSSARWFYDNDDLVDRKQTIATWFWTQLANSLVLMVILLSLAELISQRLFGDSSYTLFLQLSALTLPLGTFSKVCGNWLLYQRKVWDRSFFNVASFIMTLGLTITLTLIYKKLWAVFLSQFIAALIIAALAIWFLRSWLPLHNFSWPRLNSMFKFSLPLIPASVAYIITASIDRFILKYFASTSEVGIYTVAFFLAGIIGLITGGFQMAWGPFALSLHGREEQSPKIYSKVLDLYVWGGCFLCTIFSLFAKDILRIFTTPQYLDASTCIPFLAFAYLLFGIRDIATLGPTIAKTSIPVANSLYIMTVLNVLLNFMFIPFFGKEGAALASLLSILISTIYLFTASQKIHYIPYNFKKAIMCFCFSWFLIALSTLLAFLPYGWLLTIRIIMSFSFFLLAWRLNLLRWSHLEDLLGSFKKPSALSGII